MAAKFTRATKKKARLRMVIDGPSGAGKTYTALNIAKHLIGEQLLLPDDEQSRVALIDTERDSAQMYADIFSFNHAGLDPLAVHPKVFIETLQEAEKGGAEVIILDSMTHEWKWCLQEVDRLAAAKYRGNTWSAWKDVRGPHDAFIDVIMSCRAHVICTARAKMATVQEKNSEGKTIVQKVGMETVQDADFEYAFSIVMSMDRATHSGTIGKTRFPDIAEKVFTHPGKQFARLVSDWLDNRKEGDDVPQRRDVLPETTGLGSVTPSSAVEHVQVTDSNVKKCLDGIRDSKTVDELNLVGKLIGDLGITGDDRQKLRKAFEERRKAILAEVATAEPPAATADTTAAA
jgi:hypothetical protein